MKVKKIILHLIILLLLSSCAKPFYQLYKTKATENLVRENNNLVYEDDNCIVSYNLWSDGGDIGFRFYNKTASNIYLKLGESFFILNEKAHNYFNYRNYSISRATKKKELENAILDEKTAGRNHENLFKTMKKKDLDFTILSSPSISYSDKATICIPAKTSKNINECSINESIYRDCDLYKYPRKNQIKTVSFSKQESPFVFSNILAYSIGKTDEILQIKNDFYVSEITNYPEKEIIERRVERFCEKKEGRKKEYLKKASPDSFYVKYTNAENNFRKH